MACGICTHCLHVHSLRFYLLVIDQKWPNRYPTTVLSLTWGSPYLLKMVFIFRQGLGGNASYHLVKRGYEQGRTTKWNLWHCIDVVCLAHDYILLWICIWVRSRNCGCFVTWFCYQLIAKPGNKTAAVSLPDSYIHEYWRQIYALCQ